MRVLSNIQPTPEQLKILVDDLSGFRLMRGAAGCGKTTTALLRLRQLCRSRQNRKNRLGHEDPVQVLVLTFNRTLRSYVLQLVRERIPNSDDFVMLLSFHSDVLDHQGVVFTTTNNIYPACERAEGLAGFEAMFADRVVGRYGRMHKDKKPAWPTDRQAEVLYPGELSCNHLLTIEVQMERTADTIMGVLGSLDMDLCVRHAPEVFL